MKQRDFAKYVIYLTSVIEEIRNFFTVDNLDLLVLDTKEIMPKTVVDRVHRENNVKFIIFIIIK